jgi:hypothetical protein
LLILDALFGDSAEAIVLKTNIGCLSYGNQYSESNIMAGHGVLVADIPQPTN